MKDEKWIEISNNLQLLPNIRVQIWLLLVTWNCIHLVGIMGYLFENH